MIALDTNVVVRYLAQDDAVQSARAGEFMAGLTADVPGFICREVALELVWVLERSYGIPRADVAAVFERLLATIEIKVEAADDVGRALNL